MPTYDYLCENCGNEFELFQTITAKPLRKCPACRKNGLKRLIGPGAGVIFKGSGFHQTDYRSDSYKKAAQKERPAESTTESSKKKTDSESSASEKPAAKAGDEKTTPQKK